MIDNYNKLYFNKHQSRKLMSEGNKPYLYNYWRRYFRRKRISGKLLDAGCGLGYFLKTVSPVFDETYGFDCSEYAIEQAKINVPEAKIDVMSVDDMNYGTDCFNVVTAFDLVEHLKEPGDFIKSVNKLLKKDGLFIFSTPNVNSLGSKLKKKDWYANKDESHYSLLTIDNWRKMLIDNDFTIIKNGTDTLWDTPYFKYIPNKIQWLFFIGTTWVLVWLKGFFSWKLGENYYCIAKKR